MQGLGRLKGAKLPCILKRVTEELPTVSASGTTVKSAGRVWCSLPGVLPPPQTPISLLSTTSASFQGKYQIQRCKAGCRDRGGTTRGRCSLWVAVWHTFIFHFWAPLIFTACGMILEDSFSCFTQEPRFSRRSHERIKKIEEQPSQLWCIPKQNLLLFLPSHAVAPCSGLVILLMLSK